MGPAGLWCVLALAVSGENAVVDSEEIMIMPARGTEVTPIVGLTAVSSKVEQIPIAVQPGIAAWTPRSPGVVPPPAVPARVESVPTTMAPPAGVVGVAAVSAPEVVQASSPQDQQPATMPQQSQAPWRRESERKEEIGSGQPQVPERAQPPLLANEHLPSMSDLIVPPSAVTSRVPDTDPRPWPADIQRIVSIECLEKRKKDPNSSCGEGEEIGSALPAVYPKAAGKSKEAYQAEQFDLRAQVQAQKDKAGLDDKAKPWNPREDIRASIPKDPFANVQQDSRRLRTIGSRKKRQHHEHRHNLIVNHEKKPHSRHQEVSAEDVDVADQDAPVVVHETRHHGHHHHEVTDA